MPKDITREPVNFGSIIFQWIIQEYEKYTRSKRWYIITGSLAFIFIAYALWTEAYTFVFVIVLFAIVMYLHEVQEPLEVNFAITETGIVLGKKFYRYNELDRFWIIYNPGEVKNLYFTVNNSLKSTLIIPLLDIDPRPIRNYLSQFVLEDISQEEESLTYKWARILKIH
jgi:hypothetical protein